MGRKILNAEQEKGKSQRKKNKDKPRETNFLRENKSKKGLNTCR
jgi:hypothetical protein